MKAALSRVVVVGASSGIGEAMARQLAQAGADVAIVARREAELTRLAAERPGKLHPYAHDVSNVDEVPALFERIERDLGKVDGLIYAAGVMPKLEESEYAFEKDRAMVTVNLLGAMAWMNQAAARFEALTLCTNEMGPVCTVGCVPEELRTPCGYRGGSRS